MEKSPKTRTFHSLLALGLCILFPLSSQAGSYYADDGAGSVTEPGYSWGGDTNTGLFRPTADTVGITTGGTERLRVDSSGQLGIGTTSPAYPVDISFTSGGNYIRMQDGTGGELLLGDGTGADGEFVPIIYGKPKGSTRYSLLLSQIDAAEDTGTVAALSILTRLDSLAPLATRPVLNIRNYADTLLTLKANGNLGLNDTDPATPLSIYRNDANTTAHIKLEQDDTGDAATLYNITGIKNWIMGVDNSDGDAFKIENGATLGANNDFVIDSSGNIGINTDSPSSTLHVVGDATVKDQLTVGVDSSDFTIKYYEDVSALNPGVTAVATVLESTNSQHLIFDLRNNAGSDAIAFRYSAADNLTVDTIGMIMNGDGEVGIGELDPAYQLDVKNSIRAQDDLHADDDLYVTDNIYLGDSLIATGTDTSIYGSDDDDGTLRLFGGTGGSNGAFIYLYGTNSGSYNGGIRSFAVSNETDNTALYYFIRRTTSSSNNNLMVLRADGSATIYGSTTCNIGTGSGSTNCTSDARLKKDVKDFTGGLAIVNQLRPIRFHWKKRGEDQPYDPRERIGFLAQDVQPLLPEVIETDEDGMMSMDYASVVVPLVQAVQELSQKNQDLESKNAALQNSIQDIQTRLQAIEDK